MFALYNTGDTHEVDGVKCTIARVTVGDLDLYRSQGWVDNVEDLAKKEKPKKEKKEQTE